MRNKNYGALLVWQSKMNTVDRACEVQYHRGTDRLLQLIADCQRRIAQWFLCTRSGVPCLSVLLGSSGTGGWYSLQSHCMRAFYVRTSYSMNMHVHMHAHSRSYSLSVFSQVSNSASLPNAHPALIIQFCVRECEPASTVCARACFWQFTIQELKRPPFLLMHIERQHVLSIRKERYLMLKECVKEQYCDAPASWRVCEHINTKKVFSPLHNCV